MNFQFYFIFNLDFYCWLSSKFSSSIEFIEYLFSAIRNEKLSQMFPFKDLGGLFGWAVPSSASLVDALVPILHIYEWILVNWLTCILSF